MSNKIQSDKKIRMCLDFIFLKQGFIFFFYSEDTSILIIKKKKQKNKTKTKTKQGIKQGGYKSHSELEHTKIMNQTNYNDNTNKHT